MLFSQIVNTHFSLCSALEGLAEHAHRRPRLHSNPHTNAQLAVFVVVYTLAAMVMFGDAEGFKEMLALRMAFYAHE